MTGTEFSAELKETNFEDVIDIMFKLAEPNVVSEEGTDTEYPGWDESIRGIRLAPEVAAQVGLGQTVNARVIGDYEVGIALIMRSRNLFETRRYGFFIQPVSTQNGPRSFKVWQASARKPERNQFYWGFELLDRQESQLSSPQIVEGLINSLKNKSQ